MTKPTQAQIKAALKAYHASTKASYPEGAMKAALTAAAQVGEDEVSYSEKEVIEIINANIERCAQVAWNEIEDNEVADYVAAAIRKLRDAP